ncbi:unnamed protein product, partial [Mesorhabditis spiculigera]
MILNGVRYIFAADPVSTESLAIMYFVTGMLALACNLFNIYIFYSLHRKQRKYQIFIAIEVAEVVNCFAYITTGASRFIMLKIGIIFDTISTAGCFFTRPYGVLLIVGTQLPAIIVVISSVERLMAVYRPASYQRYWDDPFKKRLLLAVAVVQITSVVLAGMSAFFDPYINSTQHCPAAATVSSTYAAVHFLFQILSYLVSFVTLAAVYLTSKKMIISKGGVGYFRVTMLLAGFGVFVMGCPAGVSLGTTWNLFKASDVVFGIGITVPGLISVATTISNGIFHREYRRKVYNVIGRRIGCHLSARDESSVRAKTTAPFLVSQAFHSHNGKMTLPSSQIGMT